ncbi:guanine nucleotide-binding protein G(I)/G(S)/G(O) subunit gamma-13 isoform X2 [Pteropus vampyrus]|nr:guanine nucleotide-binding protein G(I)/G(S)/G(O) subunit gamma-13 isoform X2 [Pteropus vampyrus]
MGNDLHRTDQWVVGVGEKPLIAALQFLTIWCCMQLMASHRSPKCTRGHYCPQSSSTACLRLATSEAPDAMEEWDVPQMKKEVESLKYQLAFKREMSSKTIPELLKWIEDGIPKDPFLNPDLMKNNPWVEKGKCSIL